MTTITARNRIHQEDVGQLVRVYRREKNAFGNQWIAVSQPMLCELAELGRGLGDEAWRVLLHLIGSTGSNNRLLVNQSQMACELDMKQPSISRGIKKLLAAEVLEKRFREGSYWVYSLNPKLAWRGKPGNHSPAIHHWVDRVYRG